MSEVGFEPTPPHGDQNPRTEEAKLESGALDHSAILTPGGALCARTDSFVVSSARPVRAPGVQCAVGWIPGGEELRPFLGGSETPSSGALLTAEAAIGVPPRALPSLPRGYPRAQDAGTRNDPNWPWRSRSSTSNAEPAELSAGGRAGVDPGRTAAVGVDYSGEGRGGEGPELLVASRADAGTRRGKEETRRWALAPPASRSQSPGTILFSQSPGDFPVLSGPRGWSSSPRTPGTVLSSQSPGDSPVLPEPRGFPCPLGAPGTVLSSQSPGDCPVLSEPRGRSSSPRTLGTVLSSQSPGGWSSQSREDSPLGAAGTILPKPGDCPSRAPGTVLCVRLGPGLGCAVLASRNRPRPLTLGGPAPTRPGPYIHLLHPRDSAAGLVVLTSNRNHQMSVKIFLE